MWNFFNFEFFKSDKKLGTMLSLEPIKAYRGLFAWILLLTVLNEHFNGLRSVSNALVASEVWVELEQKSIELT